MKALVLNGTDEKDVVGVTLSRFIAARVRDGGADITNIFLHEKDISPCRGCFGCWIRTPGECMIDDYGRELNHLFVINDLILFIGPVFHGCHSALIKKVFDRSIPFLQPFFRKVGGEVHHKMRYAKPLDIVFVAILKHRDERQEETFRELSSRNAINFGVRNHRVLFYCRDDDPSNVIEDTVSIIEEFSR